MVKDINAVLLVFAEGVFKIGLDLYPACSSRKMVGNIGLQLIHIASVVDRFCGDFRHGLQGLVFRFRKGLFRQYCRYYRHCKQNSKKHKTGHEVYSVYFFLHTYPPLKSKVQERIISRVHKIGRTQKQNCRNNNEVRVQICFLVMLPCKAFETLKQVG